MEISNSKHNGSALRPETARGADVRPVADPPYEGDDVKKAMDKRITDRDAIRAILEEGKPVTTAMAVEMGCLRLSARIWELRHNYGLKIETHLVRTQGGDRVAEYRLA